MNVETDRLNIIALNYEQLQLLKSDRMKLESKLGLKFSNMMIPADVKAELNKSVDYWLANVEKHKEAYLWFTNWELVHKEINTSIGGFGFNGLPDESGIIEIAYVIDEKYQNKGYMTEAIRAISKWAFENSDAEIIRALTPKDNYAAQKVLFKNNFVRISEDIKTITWHLDRRDVE